MWHNTLIILIFYSFFGQQLHAQSDSTEWAPLGATWYYGFNFSGVFPAENALMMESIKDTVVQDKNARIIEGIIYENTGDTLHAADVFPEGRIILHQQRDSIYYLRENKFELLYDFSLEVGDTMNIVTPGPHYQSSVNDTMIQIVVDSTGERIIDGDTLRTQVISTNSKFNSGYLFYGEIIETIGNEIFLLPHSGFCDGNCPRPLRCYQDTSIFYKRSEIPCDSVDLISSIELRPPVTNIQLYPNPVPPGSVQIHIEGIDFSETRSFEWILRDVQGRHIYKGMESLGETVLQLPLGLQAGMYFVEIRSGNDRYVGKLAVR